MSPDKLPNRPEPAVACGHVRCPLLELRGGRGVPGPTRARSRCPGAHEGAEGPSAERRAGQSSAGPTASGLQIISPRAALRAAARLLQPDCRGAEEGAAAEARTHAHLHHGPVPFVILDNFPLVIFQGASRWRRTP